MFIEGGCDKEGVIMNESSVGQVTNKDQSFGTIKVTLQHMKSLIIHIVWLMLVISSCKQQPYHNLETDIFAFVKNEHYQKSELLFQFDTVFNTLDQYRLQVLIFAKKKSIDIEYDSAVYFEHFDIKVNKSPRGYYSVFFSSKNNIKRLYYFKVKDGSVSVSDIEVTREIESEYLKWMADAKNSMNMGKVGNNYKDEDAENYLVISMSSGHKKLSTLAVNPFWTLMFKQPDREDEKQRYIQLLKVAYLFQLTGEGSPF
jgi:hypothetical protein